MEPPGSLSENLFANRESNSVSKVLLDLRFWFFLLEHEANISTIK